MRTLITNATLLDTDPEPRTVEGDLLIEDGRIAAIGGDLAADHVIDAQGMIVMPGLVDTHRHVWQSVLRALTPDSSLGEYLDLILGTLAPAFTEDDVNAANHWGALDALDAGVTTVYDWSHIPHPEAALDGLRQAGVRAVFAHPDRDALPRLRPSGRITPALAAIGPVYGPVEEAVADFRAAREMGVHISLHATGVGAVEILHERGLLGPDVMFVHGNGFTGDAVKMMADAGATASVAPAVERQMGHGEPHTVKFRAHGIPTGLGVDTVVTVPGDLFSVMRAALPGTPAADVLRMATIEGARAIGLDREIGSLTPGKQADLIMISTDSPGMAPVIDPVAAVVASATRGDVHTVFVAGRVVGTTSAKARDGAERASRNVLRALPPRRVRQGAGSGR
ncbi:amidohydrolase family protein [Herbidospora mongoliensis]|uniref:amidohydrolase family protein n=1 Tax=Herbidospora mongoliensis TaxID=688067 RepID=UPI000837A21C|nr:amidohydrolase family protein [Herbidospora mongoliensis]